MVCAGLQVLGCLPEQIQRQAAVTEAREREPVQMYFLNAVRGSRNRDCHSRIKRQNSGLGQDEFQVLAKLLNLIVRSWTLSACGPRAAVAQCFAFDELKPSCGRHFFGRSAAPICSS